MVWLGVPSDIPNEIGQVIEGGAAEEAGIEPGDKVIAANDTEVTEWEQLVTIINEHPGDELTFNSSKK